MKMRILFLTHAFNSLGQRLYTELRRHGHDVTVEFDINDAVTEEAVALACPDLLIAPYLRRAIPASVWRRHICLVVHPGIPGDRGPSALDWAILNRERDWGVTVLQANAEMDAGDIWATSNFPMREASKSSLYRNEVTEAATHAVLRAVERFEDGSFRPRPLDYSRDEVRGQLRPLARQEDRAVDWKRDDTATVLRKIRSADGFPGLGDTIRGLAVRLYDAHDAPGLSGKAGSLLGRSGTAICRATRDGAVWIGHLRAEGGETPFKLPATLVLDRYQHELDDLGGAWSDIRYEERGSVGYLHFPFYNGAMSTSQCGRLREAYREACRRDTRVIVLMGGPDYWSNGIHLNTIEAAESAADESWANINAMNDLAREIITTLSHVTVSALQGNAGAGGVFLARAADHVWGREGLILNPHYKDMGNLYGSEYWTYLLPKRVGEDHARHIAAARLPMDTVEALECGLLDRCFGGSDAASFRREARHAAEALAARDDFAQILEAKRSERLRDEAEKPLAAYRSEELERMKLNFYGFDPSYHVARYNFVCKVPKSRTPITIAHHRDSRRRNQFFVSDTRQ